MRMVICVLSLLLVISVSERLMTGKRSAGKPGFGKMIKSFFLTLVDPSSEENLKYDSNSSSSLEKKGKAKKGGKGLFGKSPKGRTLA